MKENKEIEKCVITVKELSEDEKMERLQFLREKARRDEHSIELYGYKKGLEKGEKDKAIEIAKKLIDEGKDENYILEITGLEKNDYNELLHK